MSRKRPLSPSSSPPEIYTSPPINDRRSIFLAAYSPTLTSTTLRSLPQFADATHRITANRRLSALQPHATRKNYDTSYNDDGEKGGGRTLEKVLVEEHVEGTVIVARWFGGVMLGPVRFEHLRTAAWEAVWLWRKEYEEREEGRKRVKREEEENEERERLVRELPERDQSIVVLRGLLAGPSQSVVEESRGGEASQEHEEEHRDGVGNKVGGEEKGARAVGDATEDKPDAQEAGTNRSTAGEGNRSDGNPDAGTTTMEISTNKESKKARSPDYAMMSLDTLRKLEKVRDASISWILKQIEKKEASSEQPESAAEKVEGATEDGPSPKDHVRELG